jgi:hypothetical protein
VAATATPPTAPPSNAASAALLASGELASLGGTSCQNCCRELAQSARMALPLGEPAGRQHTTKRGGGQDRKPVGRSCKTRPAQSVAASHSASSQLSPDRSQETVQGQPRTDTGVSHTCALHMGLNQASQVGLSRLCAHSLDGHNLSVHQGREVTCRGKEASREAHRQPWGKSACRAECR